MGKRVASGRLRSPNNPKPIPKFILPPLSFFFFISSLPISGDGELKTGFTFHISERRHDQTWIQERSDLKFHLQFL